MEGRVKQAQETDRTGITGTSAVTRLCCMQKWKSSVIHDTSYYSINQCHLKKFQKGFDPVTFYLESPLVSTFYLHDLTASVPVSP